MTFFKKICLLPVNSGQYELFIFISTDSYYGFLPSYFCINNYIYTSIKDPWRSREVLLNQIYYQTWMASFVTYSEGMDFWQRFWFGVSVGVIWAPNFQFFSFVFQKLQPRLARGFTSTPLVETQWLVLWPHQCLMWECIPLCPGFVDYESFVYPNCVSAIYCCSCIWKGKFQSNMTNIF